MSYNYAAAYGTSYGQYTAQPSSFGLQQTSASGYGHYGQTAAAYGSASSGVTTSTAASSVGTHGYGASATSTTTAPSTYNFGYNYNYGGESANVYSAAAATSSLQGFQQSWYSTNPAAATATASQQPATTAQTTAQQQQQYGQYLQQYQQQMAAYQQYAAGAAAAKTDSSRQQQQQTVAWNAYNQPQQQRSQQQQAAPAVAGTSVTKTGWGTYQPPAAANQQNLAGNQQKSTNIVYRTPMKYSASNQQYGATSSTPHNYHSTNQQSFKSPSANTGYTSATQNYNQGYGTNKIQSYGAGQTYNNTNQPQQQHHHQQFGSNQGMKKTSSPYNQNQGFQSAQSSGSNYSNQSRGGFGGLSNSNNVGPMGMNLQGSQRGGIRPAMPQRSPMAVGGGGPGFGGNMGPRGGPDIPPFPRAWHPQDENNDSRRGFGEQKDRRGAGGRGGFNQPNRGMYNNNSRNPRGANRELWSPAQKNVNTVKQEKEKPTFVSPPKKEEAEKIDKDKHPEIKSYIYAWLGARHTRPTYDIRQIGERPSIMFRCDLRVEKYSFVGVGKATNKKEAQTTAAWKFAEYLVKIGEISEVDLPNKQITPLPEETEVDIGDVREEKEKEGETPNAEAQPKRENDNRNRDRRGPGRGRGNRRGNQNWGPVPELMGEIPPLMAVPIGPWGAPSPMPMGPPPPRMMAPPPLGLMDYGPPFWDDGPWMRPPMGMGPPPPMRPPMPMRPPPPFMRRNQQNDFWRRRDIEERMMDLSRNQDWTHPEDMFISQMIRNQQEGERRQRGHRGPMLPPMESAPGEWERVQQQARPIVTSDDRHVMAKHGEIYPQEGELKNLHRIINTVEQALKLLSDKFVDEDHPREDAKKDNSEKTVEEEATKEEKKAAEGDNKETAGEKSEIKEEKKAAEGDNKESAGEKSEIKEEKKAAEGDNKESAREKSEIKEEKAAAEGDNKETAGEKSEGENKEEETETVNKEGDESKEEKEEAGNIERSDSKEEDKETEEKKDEKRAKIKILKRPKRIPKQVDTRPRILCGVNRIGPLAKGLLITKDDRVELALLCGEIPTDPLLDRIMCHVEEKLREVDEEFKLIVERKQDEAGFLVKSLDETSPVEVMVILTAMVLKRPADKVPSEKDDKNKKEEDAAEEPEPAGMLPKRKMLDALACLRHTHWFQAKACGVQSCVILTRILRDMQRRDETWDNLSEWALEVLIFNCLTSTGEQLSPGDACRRFFEVLAGGILMPDMPGIADPCEKSERRDVLDCLSVQKKEDITRSAQGCLRRLAFRDIHIILGMEKLVPNLKHENHPGNKSTSKDQNSDIKVEEKEKPSEPNNQRKRRFEHNESDSVAESPKRSLTDEEDTDTQQNLAELSISDEASEGRDAALDETEGETKEKSEFKEDDIDLAMETSGTETELTKAEEDALLEEDDKMSS